MTLLLAADIGNSKTDLLLVDEAGTVRAGRREPRPAPSHHGVESFADTARYLAARADDLARGAGVDAPVTCSVAAAGLDFADEYEAMADALGSVGRFASWTVENDVVGLMRSATPTPDGIAVVAGAGLNCVGRLGEAVVRYPALGMVSGDWGGGQLLGELVLYHACRSADGREGPSGLPTLVAGHFGVAGPEDVTLAIHRRELNIERLAELVPALFAAARAGDAAAAALVHRQSDEVIALVRATSSRLGVAVGALPVVLGGSILRHGGEIVHAPIRAGLPGTSIVVPDWPPVVGAALLGADALGWALDPDALQHESRSVLDAE